MASFITKVLSKTIPIILRWGAKMLPKILSALKSHWKTIVKWIANWALWEILERIVNKITTGKW